MKDGMYASSTILRIEILKNSPGKADKSLDWLDAWKDMEKIYETQKDKVRAIGTHIPAFTQLRSLTEPPARRFQLLRGVSRAPLERSQSRARREPG